MVHTCQVDGKKTAAVHVFIDPENGFSQPGISEKNGGSLYVPKGEEVGHAMGKIIRETRNGTFVIAQDYHPRTHISFTVNHPGILDYRIEKYKAFLTEHNQPVPGEKELREAAQQPVHFFDGHEKAPYNFPFEEIVINGEGNIIGLKQADGRIRKVEVTTKSGKAPSTTDRGRVSKVLDEYLDHSFDEMRAGGELLRTQTIWTTHCVHGTHSSLYPESMHLPKGLTDMLEGDLMSPSIHYHDPETDNDFYIVRKGTNSEIDSYGIGVENDGETLTPAFDVFTKIAQNFKTHGIERVETFVGGLATNFCVEFSANHLSRFLTFPFEMRNMESQVHFIPELSRAIPIPGGKDVPFSADGAPERMASKPYFVESMSLEEMRTRQQLGIKPGGDIAGDLDATSGQHKEVH